MGKRRSFVACALSVLLGAACLAVVTSGTAPVAAASCDNSPIENAPMVKVLVIGDSLTQGFVGDYSWRYRFWQAERAKNVNIDFVGPLTSQMATFATPYSDGLYADPCFNQREHFAVGGKTLHSSLGVGSQSCPDGAAFSGSEVAWATTCYQPDVVIGFMGYNDLKAVADKGLGRTPDQVLGDAMTFISQVQNAKPGTSVAMAGVASSTATPVFVDGSAYNAKLKAGVGALPQSNGPVGLIDVMKDWNGYPNDTWDKYHPNANGEMHLAWDVADGLHDLSLVPALDRPIPVQPLGPRTPGTVSASNRTPSSVSLTWSFPVGADREVLYRRDVTTGSAWTVVDDSQYSSGVSLAGLAAHRYQFKVRAAKGSALAEITPGVPLYSVPIDVDLSTPDSTPPDGPGAVQGLRVVPGYHLMDLSWTPIAGTSRYVIAWRRAGDPGWRLLESVGASRRLSGLVAGQSYEFSVRADLPSSGPYGSHAFVRPTGVVPGAPPRPKLTRLSGHRILVDWKPVSGATRYQVQIRVGTGAWRVRATSSSSRYTTGRLVMGRSYGFRIRSYHQLIGGGVSAGSRISAS